MKRMVDGQGPQHHNFGPGSQISNEMAQSIGTQEFKDYVSKTYEKNIPQQGQFVNKYGFDFGVKDAFDEGLNPSSQFVGSWQDATEITEILSEEYGITEPEFDGYEYWPGEEPFIFLAKWFYPKYLKRWKPMTVRELAQHIYNAIEKKNKKNL